MISHLREIEDAAARDGVNTYKTQMEIVVLSLLHPDRDMALVQIGEAQATSLEFVKNLGSPFVSIDHDAKAGRVAVGMLEHTFDRLRIVMETPDDFDPGGEP